MSDQSYEAERNTQYFATNNMNENNYQQNIPNNMSTMFPPSVNTDNSLMNMTEHNTNQMFHIFSNMMKMMQSQNSGTNLNSFAQPNIAGGIPGFPDKSLYPPQNNLPAGPISGNNGMIDPNFRNIEDRFISQQNDLQNFYGKMQGQSQTNIQHQIVNPRELMGGERSANLYSNSNYNNENRNTNKGNTQLTNHHQKNGNPHLNYQNNGIPHQNNGNSHQNNGNPHQNIGNPHQNIGNPHQNNGNPLQNNGNLHQNNGNLHQNNGNPHINNNIFEMSAASEQLPSQSDFVDFHNNFDLTESLKQNYNNQNLPDRKGISRQNDDHIGGGYSNSFKPQIHNSQVSVNNLAKKDEGKYSNIRDFSGTHLGSDKKQNLIIASDDNEFLRESFLHPPNQIHDQLPDYRNSNNQRQGGVPTNQFNRNKLNRDDIHKEDLKKSNNGISVQGLNSHKSGSIIGDEYQHPYSNGNVQRSTQNRQDLGKLSKSTFMGQNKQYDDVGVDDDDDDYEKHAPLSTRHNNQPSIKNMDDERPIRGAQKKNLEIEPPLYSNSRVPLEDYDDDERPIKSAISSSTMNNKNSIPPIKQSTNPFEDMPIKSCGTGKRFEDLIEEKLQEEKEMEEDENNSFRQEPRSKSFLKKGSRAYLSNAQQRSKAAQSHIETIQIQEHGEGMSSVTMSTPSLNMGIKSKKNVSTNIKGSGQVSGGFPGAMKGQLNQVQSSNAFDTLPNGQHISALELQSESGNLSGNNSKSKKKFLQRGKGKGGGVLGANVKKEEGVSANVKKEELDWKNQVSTSKEVPQPRKKEDKRQSSSQNSQKQMKTDNTDLLSLDEEEDDTYTHLGYNRQPQSKLYENEDNFDDDLSGKRYEAFKYMDDKNQQEKQQQSYRPLAGQAPHNEKIKQKNILAVAGTYQFDDEEEWGEEPSKGKKKQLGANEGQSDEEEEFVHLSDKDERGQKSSKVVQKYFNKKPVKQVESGNVGSEGVSLNELTGEQKKQIVEEYTNEQIERLNSEISKFKLENERVKKMRSKYEELLKAFNKEKEQFAKQKELEIQELEEWKKEEQKKIRNEKRISERQQKAMQNMPNRKEREEIEGFKTVIKKLQEELKMKEQRNKLSFDRQKKLLDEQTQRNQELLEDIKHLEKLRIETTGTGGKLQNTASNRVNVSKPQSQMIKNSTTQSNNYDEYDTDNKSKRGPMAVDIQKKKITNFGKDNQKGRSYEDEREEEEEEAEDNTEEDEEEEEVQYENYENYHNKVNEDEQQDNDFQAPSGGTKGMKTNQQQKNRKPEGKQQIQSEEEEDDLETYEDIINFNPSNNKNSYTDKTNKRETTKPPSTSIRNAKQTISSSIPIENNITKKGEKENKQIPQSSSSTTSFSSQKVKQFKYDITHLYSHKNISINMINKEIDAQQFQFDQNIFYQTYLNQKKIQKIISQNTMPDGKVQILYEDGKNEVIFQNNVRRQVFPNGYTLVNFVNKDIKQVLPDTTIIYYFADAETSQTTLPQGINIYKFPSDQIEIHYPSGKKEIRFSDGTEKYISENGEEKTYFQDGAIQTVDINKVKSIRYKSGKEDVIYPDQYSSHY